MSEVASVGRMELHYLLPYFHQNDTFEAVYGRTPSSIATFIPGSTIDAQVEQELLDRDAISS